MVGQADEFPTPQAADGERASEQGVRFYEGQGDNPTLLGAALRVWPTPIAGDAHLSSTPETAEKRMAEGRETLSRAAEASAWPTPTAGDEQRGRQPNFRGAENPSLGSAVDAWPTPRVTTPGFADDGKGGKSLGVEGESWHTPHGIGNQGVTGARAGPSGNELGRQAGEFSPVGSASYYGDYRDALPGERGDAYWKRIAEYEAAHPEEVAKQERAVWPTPLSRDRDPRRGVMPASGPGMDRKREMGAINAAGLPSDDLGSAAANWPTPTQAPEAKNLGSNQKGSTPCLADAARASMPDPRAEWQTPTGSGIGSRRQVGAEAREDLLPQQAEKWPTPKTPTGGSESRESRESRGAGGEDLEARALKWPTPAARDVKNGDASPETLARNSRPLNEIAEAEAKIRDAASLFFPLDPATPHGPASSPSPRSSPLPSRLAGKKRLNPKFMEWLMGLPRGWTSLKTCRGLTSCGPSGTEWSHSQRQRLLSLCSEPTPRRTE